MKPTDLYERQLPDGLVDLADARVPSYLDDILAESRRMRQRPRRTFIERWLPMALITARPATAPPLRSAWLLLITGLVVAALAASLVIVGALVLRPDDPDGTNALALVPTLELDETWDATTIPGLRYPSGMDLGPDGNIYLVNAATREIVVLDPEGRVLRRWGRKGSGPGEFDFQTDPTDPATSLGGVAVAPDGSVYVVDPVNDRVQQFDADGRFVREWGRYGLGDGEFVEPTDIDVDDQGAVYVVDRGRQDIQRFSAEGSYEGTIASDVSGDGLSNDQGTVYAGPEGVIYSADYGNDRVQAFQRDGTPLWSLGAGRGAVTFRSPGDLGLDADGFLYVSDLDGLRVFDADHTMVGSWSPPESDLNADWFPFVVSPDGWVYMGSEESSVVYRLRIVPAERTVGETISTGAPTMAPVATSPATRPTAETPEPGSRLVIDETFLVPFSVDLPPTWVRTDLRRGRVQVGKGRDPLKPAWVGVYLPTGTYSDPCRTEQGPVDPPIGPSVEDLTEALTTLVDFRAGPVSDITIDGYHGKTFDLEHSIDISTCSDDPWLTQMTYDGGMGDSVIETGVGAIKGMHQRIAILDVEGTRVLIQTWTFNHGSLLKDVAEAHTILESIDFH